VVGIVGQTVKLATRKIGSAQGWLLLGLVSVSTRQRGRRGSRPVTTPAGASTCQAYGSYAEDKQHHWV